MTKETDVLGRLMAPSSCPHPNPPLWTCEYVTLHDKRDFADVTSLRILINLEYPDGPNLITRSPWWLKMEGEESLSDPMWEKLDLPLLALKIEKAPQVKECECPPEAGKVKEKETPLEVPERSRAMLIPWF